MSGDSFMLIVGSVLVMVSLKVVNGNGMLVMIMLMFVWGSVVGVMSYWVVVKMSLVVMVILDSMVSG